MSHFDRSDAEGIELGDSDVECIHGVDLLEPCAKCKHAEPDAVLCGMCLTAPASSEIGLCDECTDFDAAHSGEVEDDMEDLFDDADARAWDHDLNALLDRATDLQLKQARYAVERKQNQRLEEARATIRALDPKAPKPRARRKDAGKPRAEKEHAA